MLVGSISEVRLRIANWIPPICANEGYIQVSVSEHDKAVADVTFDLSARAEVTFWTSQGHLAKTKLLCDPRPMPYSVIT